MNLQKTTSRWLTILLMGGLSMTAGNLMAKTLYKADFSSMMAKQPIGEAPLAATFGFYASEEGLWTMVPGAGGYIEGVWGDGLRPGFVYRDLAAPLKDVLISFDTSWEWGVNGDEGKQLVIYAGLVGKDGSGYLVEITRQGAINLYALANNVKTHLKYGAYDANLLPMPANWATTAGKPKEKGFQKITLSLVGNTLSATAGAAGSAKTVTVNVPADRGEITKVFFGAQQGNGEKIFVTDLKVVAPTIP